MTKLDPVPGYVVKTTTLVGAKRKIFINICVDQQVLVPEITDIAEITTTVMKNEDWIVPIIVSPERSVTDKAGNPAQVFDCCMNPKVLLLGAQDPGIKVLINETCIELVEDASGYELDRNYTIPKMKSKGELQNTEFSAEDFKKRPKALEEILSEAAKKQNSPAQLTTPTPQQPKPVIELIDDTVPKYKIGPYSREWGGNDAQPLIEVEVPGQHQLVKVEGATLVINKLKIPLENGVSKTEAIYTRDDDTLHIFVW